jgi:tRNA (cmo5U34)-methyltransferase
MMYHSNIYGGIIVGKSTVEQIRERFDNDVERFSKLEEGNMAQVDSALSLDLIAHAAAATTPKAKAVLDVGCGAGNYTLKVLEQLPNLEVSLLDLSLPMLERARERVSQVTTGSISLLQGDVRDLDLGVEQFDVIVASAVLHHLRAEPEWELVFGKFYAALRPGGTVWIYDLVRHTMPEIEQDMDRRYDEYLVNTGGESYRDKVRGWIEMEDSPFQLMFQIDTLRKVGFREVDILHKTVIFSAFGARK